MKKALVFILIVVAILVLTAVLAPIAFEIIHAKFERIISRLLGVFALLAIIIFGKLRINLKSYGLQWRNDSLKLFLVGFLAAFCSLVVLLVIEFLLGAQVWSYNLTAIGLIKHIFGCLLIGIVVGVIEEFFFRGFIFEKISSKLGVWFSLIITSAFYSAVHFMRAKTVIAGPNPTVYTSFRVMLDSLTPFFHFQDIYQPFVGLFLFGLLLSFLYLKTGRNLILPIAVHAGAVFYMKMDGQFAYYAGPADSLLYGGGDIRVSVLAWTFVGLIICYFVAKRLFGTSKSDTF